MRAAKLAMARKMLTFGAQYKNLVILKYCTYCAPNDKELKSFGKSYTYDGPILSLQLKEHQEKKFIPNDNNIENESKDVNIVGELVVNVKDEVNIEPEVPIFNNNSQNMLQNLSPRMEQELLYTDSNQIDCGVQLEQQIKAMEILTVNKRQLEMQVYALQNKITQIEAGYNESVNTANNFKHHIKNLELQIYNIKDSNGYISNELAIKTKNIEELHAKISSLTDSNNNLSEQLDITKTALMAKEAENASLNSLLTNTQKRLDVTELRLQQLSHGMAMDSELSKDNRAIIQENEKVLHLNQQLSSLQNEYKQMKLHYEQYVAQLNEQLNSMSLKHMELMQENNVLSNRENSLIDQISSMELQLQQLRASCEAHIINTSSQAEDNTELETLRKLHRELEDTLKDLQDKYADVTEKLRCAVEINAQRSASDRNEEEHLTHSVNLSKLNADMVSDKVAAQMATAQNKQLKTEIQDLKEVYIKTSQDKLELTEKLDAEKFLNRELTLKLSEIEEKAKETHSKLMAKDTEMIRILSNSNELEKQLIEVSNKSKRDIDSHSINNGEYNTQHDEHSSDHNESSTLLGALKKTQCFTEESNNELNISIHEAMLKLQDRFLRNMKEVADLSDEKHRLEHIIMQLQSETDTICEYVALYQQQRGILKKREEERKEQLKLFEMERDKMKSQLEDLGQLVSQFAVDKDLQNYFQHEARKQDVSKIIDLVINMKANHLVDTSKQCIEYDSFYPCSCCSGKVTVV